MTMVDTTQLPQDQIPFKPQRRMSATTISTSATSIGSSTRSDAAKPGLALPAERSNSLMRILAKDVVSSLFEKNGDADDLSEGESLCSNMSRLNLDLEHIADLVLAQVEKQHKGSDHELRKLLRDSLANDDCASDEDDDVLDMWPLCVDETSGHTRKSEASAAISHRTSSTVSDISMATGGAKTTVDIFHPEFWGSAVQTATDDVGTRATNSTRSTGQSVYTILSSDLDQVTTHSRASLHELIQKVNEAPSESDSEPDMSDSSSILSDITGLTGCFEDSSSTGRTRKEAVPESPTARPIPTQIFRSSPSMEGSIVGSLVNSKASSKKSAQQKGSEKHSLTRRVSFGSVNVRHYERIMCDNPSSTNGPSVGIGWEYVNKRPKEIDEFEKNRQRRHKSELLLPRAQREKIIKSLGYTEREIAATVRELNKSRFQRRQTVNNLGAAKLEESLEHAKRQVLKALFLKKKQLDY